MSQLEVDKIIPQSGTTLTIGDSGDTVNFADGTSIGIDTNTLYIDSTNNRVGIGTNSPDRLLHVKSTGNTRAKIEAGTASTFGQLYLGTENQFIIGYGSTHSVADALSLKNLNASGTIRFFNSGDYERMRINSSGSLLVGKTTEDYESTAGHILRDDGLLNVTRSGGNVTDFNRLSSDGEVVRISKDGTTLGGFHATGGTIDVRRQSGTNGLMLKFSQPTHGVVGAIGNTSVDFYITNNSSGSTNAGIKLSNNNKVVPMLNASSSDNVTDLGSTTARWKDLYLGGGLYVGGTGTANKLDDYEEGTWTPTYVGTTTDPVVTYSASRFGTYTKIGDTVYIQGLIAIATLTSAGTGNMQIGGLPFTASSSYRSAITIGGNNDWGSNNHPSHANVINNTTEIRLLKFQADPQDELVLVTASGMLSGGNDNSLTFAGFYKV